MRDFFIQSFEMIVNVIVVVLAVGVVVGAIGTMFSDEGGFLQGLMVLIGGAVWVLFTGGIMYLGLGIYQNTRQTHEAIQRLADRP